MRTPLLTLIFGILCAASLSGCASRGAEPCEPACLSHEICDDGACLPRSCDPADEASCGAELRCVEGVCRPGQALECSDDEGCPGGRCVDGACFADECEGGESRPCESACGAGTSLCVQGAWRGCDARQPAPSERCGDDVDDDCDGQIDEGCVGCEADSVRLCETACGGGQEQCVEGAWTGCDAPIPAEEDCEAAGDEDCDGEVDEGCAACALGDTRPCTTDCGAGASTCVGQGVWGECDAPSPVEGRCPGQCEVSERLLAPPVVVSEGPAWVPRVAALGVGFAALWRDNAGPDGKTWMRLMSAGGAPRGEVIAVSDRLLAEAVPVSAGLMVITVQASRYALTPVTTLGRVGVELAVDALRGASFLTAVEGGGGVIAVYSADEDLQLTAVGDDGVAEETVPLTNLPGRSWQPSVVRRGGTLMVAWADGVEAPEDPFTSAVFVARFDVSGAPLGLPQRIGSGSEPALVRAGAGYGLIWTARREGAPDAIFFAPLDEAGALAGAAVEISQTTGHARDGALAWDGAGYLIVWTDRKDGGQPLYGARVDQDGGRRGEPFRLSDPARHAGMPAVIYDTDRFALVWYEGGGDLNDDDTDVYFAAGSFDCPR